MQSSRQASTCRRTGSQYQRIVISIVHNIMSFKQLTLIPNRGSNIFNAPFPTKTLSETATSEWRRQACQHQSPTTSMSHNVLGDLKATNVVHSMVHETLDRQKLLYEQISGWAHLQKQDFRYRKESSDAESYPATMIHQQPLRHLLSTRNSCSHRRCQCHHYIGILWGASCSTALIRPAEVGLGTYCRISRTCSERKRRWAQL